MIVCYTVSMNKSQNKNRAINIKVYGQTVRVLGGKVAGQYTGAFTTKKSTRKRPSAKQGINWKRVKLILKVIIALIVFSWICSHLEYRPPVKPVPVVEAKEQEWQFPKEYYSADKPWNEDYFDKYFKKDAKIMRAICQAESGLNPKAISKINRNKTRDYGICQINSIHADHVDGDLNRLLDEETNIRVSAEILKDQGFNAWTVFNNGSYKKFLK